MRKRYSEQDLEFIEREARSGTDCKLIGDALGVSATAIQHVLSRRGIRFCRNPLVSIAGEIWVDCPGLPDIQISNLGRFVRMSSGSVIDGYITTGGYVTVDISGIGTFSAHRLVAQTFVPNPENKPEVNHKDGCKANNSAYNLEWVTPSENVQHAFRTGLATPRYGQNHPRTALTTEEIIDSVKMRDEGKTFQEIANIYGVHWKTISRHIDLYRRSVERPETIP